MSTDWSSYLPTDQNFAQSEEWVEFDVLRHTSHLPAARRIAEDQQVTSQLIYDGMLNKSRTKGVFLSPNHWGAGYIYGSIQFTLQVEKILAGRSLYWLEVIDFYSIPIMRFLVSNAQNIPHGAALYDPCREKGPIREAQGILYRPKNCVIEFIVDEDISIASFDDLQFVSHHSEYCIRHLSDCPEKRRYQQAWAGLTGFLIGSSLIALNPLLCKNGRLTSDALTGLNFLWGAMTKGNNRFGGSVREPDHARHLLHAAMLDLFNDEARQRGRILISMMETEAIFNTTFENAIREHFALPSFCLSELGD